MMEAARVLVEEILEKRVAAWQLTDSSAALAIVAGDTSSWKTRHLRKRARYLRLKVSRGEIALRHCPGLTMVADIGTKPLHAPRLETLKESMGMYMPKRHDDLRKEDDGQKDDAGGLQEENHKVMARNGEAYERGGSADASDGSGLGGIDESGWSEGSRGAGVIRRMDDLVGDLGSDWVVGDDHLVVTTI